MKPKEVNYLEKIYEYNNQLKGNVKHMNDHIDTVLVKHEQDFLNAFKCQMFSLNSQIRELKKKNEDNEVKLKRDEQINKLQKSLEFFQDEAVKLGESSQYFKKEADKWKAKAESLEDDRKFLENQLKATKRKIKLLQVEAEPMRDSEESMKSSIFKTNDIITFKFVPNTRTGELLLDLMYKHHFHIEDFLTEAEKTFNEIENKFNESVKHLKNCLEAEKKKNKMIAAQQNSILNVKSEMENLFLECVDEVKKDVWKRKVDSITNQKFKRSNMTAKENNYFPATDKRRILELLVSKEKVLMMLYEKIFPHRAAQYSQTVKIDDKNEVEDIEELIRQVPSKSDTERQNRFRGKSAPYY